jgi:flagellar hook-length control protein FliK
LLDGRLSVPRDRPADVAQRHAFHRLLDRFTQNDGQQDPAKDTVSATRDQRPRERSCSTDDSPRPSDDASTDAKAADPTDAPAAPAQTATPPTDSATPRTPDAAPAANPPAPAPVAVPVAAIVPVVTAPVTAAPTNVVATATPTAPIVVALPAASAAVEATTTASGPAPAKELAAAADAAKPAATPAELTADAAVPITAADLLNLAQAARPAPRTKPTAMANANGPRPPLKAANATATDKVPADAAAPQPNRLLAAHLAGGAPLAGSANGNADGAQGLSQIRIVKTEASAAATDATLKGLREEHTASNGADQPIATLIPIDSPSRSAALYHKVADAAKPGADAPTPADQISIRLVHAVAEGKRAIQMHLHPAELGSIDVKLQWQGDKLTAQFTVDRPETLQILQREVPALERSLGQAGVNVDSGSLSFMLRQQQGNGRGNGEGFDQAAANAGLGDGGDLTGDEQLGQVIRDGILSIRV